MPEPPMMITGDGHVWVQRTDGPSSVAINGYNAMVMRWYGSDRELKRFVYVGTTLDDPSPQARVMVPTDPHIPGWASWYPLGKTNAPTT